jgi:CHASE3 domain sensor protein
MFPDNVGIRYRHWRLLWPLAVAALCLQEDPAKALSDAERLKRQRMEEEESERSQRLLLEQVGVGVSVVWACLWKGLQPA